MNTLMPVNTITLDEAKVGDVLVHCATMLDFGSCLVYKIDQEKQIVCLARPFAQAVLTETLAPTWVMGVEQFDVPMSFSMVRIGTGHKLPI